MSHLVEEQIFVKLFIGSPVTSDLRVELERSHEWKEAQIVRIDNKLEETLCDGKKYIGLYTHAEKTLAELDELKNEIKFKIKEFCPNYPLEKLKFFIFPQVFIG